MIKFSKCNFCGNVINVEDWIVLDGGVIECPRCHEEIMDICFTTPVEGGCDCCFKEAEC